MTVLKTAILRATGCSRMVFISLEVLFNPDINHSHPRAPDTALRVHSVAHKVPETLSFCWRTLDARLNGPMILFRVVSGALVDSPLAYPM